MDIEQIGLLVAGWLAVGFLVALALGKMLREANESDRLDPEVSLVVSEAFKAPGRRGPQRQRVGRKKRATSHAASL